MSRIRVSRPGGDAAAQRDGWLLLRRDGSLWGLRRSALATLCSGSRLELRDGRRLAADEVLGLTAALEPHDLPRCARRFGALGVAGLALFEGEPVLLVDPAAPPPCLEVDSLTGDHAKTVDLAKTVDSVEIDAHESSPREA